MLAILGAGIQARSHLEAMRAVRDFDRVVVWSRTPRARIDGVEEAASAEEAVRDADVIVTATSAAEPILERGWLKPGVHINAVGSSIPTTRELDTETMRDAALFVDRRESTVNEAGDFLFPQREGAIGAGAHPRRDRRVADRRGGRRRRAGGADGVQVARPRGRGSRRRRACRARAPRPRTSARSSRFDRARRDPACPRGARRHGNPHAARPARRRRGRRDLVEAGGFCSRCARSRSAAPAMRSCRRATRSWPAAC